MSVFWTVIGFVTISVFLVMIFVILRISSHADTMAGYDEEYANDLFDDDEEYY